MPLLDSLQKWHYRILLRYPPAFLCLFLLVTLAAGAQFRKFQVDVSSAPFFPRDDPATIRLERFQQTFATHETVLLAVEFPDTVFSDRSLEHLTRLQDTLARLVGSHSVWSLVNVDSLAQHLVASRSLADLSRYMLENPRYRSSLVSGDGKAAAFILGPPPRQRGPEQDRLLVRELDRIVERERLPGCRYHLSGMPVIRVNFSDLILKDQRLFGLLAAVLLSLFMLLLFRTFWGVVVPLACGGLSVIWTLGLFFATGHRINLVSSVLSLLVAVISMTNSIHLINYFVHRLKQSGNKRDALKAALDHALLPCLIATVDTMLGFFSLLTTRIPAVRDFSLFASLGIVISFLLTGTLVPILLYRWVDLDSARRVPFDRGLVARALTGILGLVADRRGRLTLFSVVLFSLLGLGIARVHTTMDVMDSFPQDSPLTRASRYLQDKFIGAHVLEAVVIADGDDLLTVEHLQRITALDEFLGRQPEVRSTLSAMLFVRPYLESYLRAPEELRRIMPMQQSFRSTLAMMQPSQRQLLRVFMDRRYRSLRISVFLTTADSRTVSALADRIQTRGAELLGPGLRLELTGELLLFSRISTDLVRNLLLSLLQAFLVIFLVIGILFRSVKAVLAGIVPNVVPILAMFGVMGWLGIPLTVPTSIVACITLGLTVDDTTHFLHNYRARRREGSSPQAAVRNALSTVGRAMIFSSLVLILGFSLGVLSPFRIIAEFGFLAAVTMLLGLWCELTLTPVCILAVERLFRSRAGKKPVAAAIVACCLCSSAALAGSARAAEAFPGAGGRALRMATLAPEGSPWADFARDAAHAVRDRTSGTLALRWTLGAARGDERSMIEQIQTGKLDGAVISMAGLARVSPSVTLLALPFLFRDTAEAERVTRLLTPTLEERFLSRGIVLAGLFSLGFGRIFTSKPVADLAQLEEARIWTWKGEELGRQTLEGLGFRRLVPLEMTDVLPALQFGMLDAFSGTCFSVTVLQWFPHARYMIPLNWTYTLGGVVVGQAAFGALNSGEQLVLRQVLAEFAARLTEDSLRLEKEAETGLARKEGLQRVSLAGNEVEMLEERARRLYPILAGQKKEEDLLQRIREALVAIRAGGEPKPE